MAIQFLTQTQVDNIHQLYASYFGRDADASGADYWGKEYLAQLNAGMTDEEIQGKMAANFALSAEYAAKYPSTQSVSTFIDTIYQNVLGRVADDAGKAYWTTELTSGAIAKSDFILAIINAVEAGSSTTDAAYLAAKVASSEAAVAGAALAGTTYTLSTTIDTVVGTSANDTINALIDGANTTLTDLDAITGGAGTDTLNLNILKEVDGGTDPVANLPAASVSGVEVLNVRSAVGLTADVKTWSGLTNANVTQGTDVDLTVASTTAVSISGATGDVAVNGGSTVTVNTAGGDVEIGNLAAATADLPAGAVSVTHTALVGDAIVVDGGTTVNVTASGVAAGSITIGGNEAASGAVTVSSTGAAVEAATPNALAAITVTGGTSVTVTQVATSDAAAAATDTSVGGSTLTQGAVTVHGDDNTTSVTVTQTKWADHVQAVEAEAGVKQTTVVTFAAMTAGDTMYIDGLTFTASQDLTAAEVAAAFANLAKSSTQGTSAASNGIYSGTLSSSWTSGAVVQVGSGDTATYTVTFTAAKAADAVLTLVLNDPGIALATEVIPTQVAGDVGNTEIKAVTGAAAVVGGAVTIDSTAVTGTADKISTVTLSGYGAGSTIASDALTTLSIANSKSDLVITNTEATTLSLTVNKIGDKTAADPVTLLQTTTQGVVNIGATYETLNLVTAGSDSYIALTAGGVTALNVSGVKAADLSTGSTLTNLAALTVSGSASITLAASTTLATVDASATSGKVTLKGFDATLTDGYYKGGSGADSVTVTSATVDNDIALGAGDDSITLKTTTTAVTGLISGGDGTDTLALAAADAVTFSASAVFEAQIDSFEKLSLSTAGVGVQAIDLANLDDISYVVTKGTAGTLTLSNMANGGTLELAAAAAGATVVDLVDATGTADSFNVVVAQAGLQTGTPGVGVTYTNYNSGLVQADGVETINLTVTDTKVDSAGNVDSQSLTLVDADMTTLTIKGNANLSLTLDATTNSLKTIDASAFTGKLTAGTDATVGSATLTGGSAADTLTANGLKDALVGGAGNDTLIVNADLVKLTGGVGADVFNVSTATSNVNAYATITDLAAGDFIKFAAGAADFVQTAIALDDTAVFQDYANKAIASTDTGELSWFQYNGNTYVIENVSNDASAFVNATDIIVKITGLVDLSTASFSSSADTLLIV